MSRQQGCPAGLPPRPPSPFALFSLPFSTPFLAWAVQVPERVVDGKAAADAKRKVSGEDRAEAPRRRLRTSPERAGEEAWRAPQSASAGLDSSACLASIRSAGCLDSAAAVCHMPLLAPQLSCRLGWRGRATPREKVAATSDQAKKAAIPTTSRPRLPLSRAFPAGAGGAAPPATDAGRVSHPLPRAPSSDAFAALLFYSLRQIPACYIPVCYPVPSPACVGPWGLATHLPATPMNVPTESPEVPPSAPTTDQAGCPSTGRWLAPSPSGPSPSAPSPVAPPFQTPPPPPPSVP